MNKRLLIGGIAVILAGLGVVAFLSLQNSSDSYRVSKEELAKQMAQYAAGAGLTNAPTQAMLVPLDMAQPVRLAVGGLGLTDNNQNQQLGDLVTAELTSAKGFSLVERQSLTAILRELNLSLSGFVRARDAVRVGKLLKVDWFLLGTEAKLNGTNALVIRVVDARTGIMRDAGVVSANQPASKMAVDVATFVRQSRQNAALAKSRVYLAIGAFEDFSVNNRQADFPTQLHGYLIAAYQGANVTLLEREYVETLLQEVRLDLAGLTEDSGTNPPPPMQSAFWLVSGQYQSYETTNLQVEINLEVQRIFGQAKHFTMRGLPGESVGHQIKAAIDETMNQNSASLIVTRASEARIQMSIGKDLTVWNGIGSHDDYGLVVIGSNWYGNSRSEPQLAAKQKRRLEGAIRSFETVLLLEPNNHEAKMYLAACLRNQLNLHPDEACNYYREIINDPVQDKWSGLAQQALAETFLWFGPEEKLRWLQSAGQQTTNAVALTFYRAQTEAAQNEIILRSGDSPKAGELAEKKLFESLQSFKSAIQGQSGHYSDDMGMDDYVAVFNWDRTTAAQKLAELLPKMKQQAPGLEPYLLATVLTYQADTNTPLVAEFQQTLKHCIESPKQILAPNYLWNKIRWSAYEWCLQKTNYPLAIQLLEGERRAGAEGYVDYDDQEKIKLAYVYMAEARWQDALNIFESFTNRPVKATADGVWGAAFKPILTDKLAARCRQQLGAVATEDARVFDMGKPVLCMHTPSTFIADDNGIWVGIAGQLLHLDFDLKTNLAVRLPVDDSVPITALCVTASNIWIGTRGAGLIDFDKASHQGRRLTEADGLLMNDLASLELAGDSLWIGYGGATGGGLGQLDLRSQKLISFMPSLNANSPARTGETPPRDAIRKITAGNDGDLLMSVASGVRQFHAARDVWETLPNKAGDWVTSFSADSAWLVEGGGFHLTEIEIQNRSDRNAPTNEIKKNKMVVTSAELSQLQANLRTNGSHQHVSSYSSGGISPRGALAIQNLRDHRWQNLVDADGLPNPPSTLTVDGNNVWAGGEGAIALVDLNEAKVKKFCHIKATGVDRIQIAGGYVWAQFDWHLYRASLSALQ
jgi:hypothetical protein